MRRVSVLAWMAVIGLMGAAAAGQEAAAPEAPSGPAPKAVCDEPVFDFKEIWSGDKVEHAFVIRNTGDAVLDITEVRAGCGCTATEYDKQIQPGQTGKVKAVLTTTRMSGKLSKQVFVGTNDPQNARITLTLQGSAKARVGVTPPTGADFGRVTLGEVEPRKVRLTNHTETPMKVELVDPSAQHAVFKFAIEEIEAGKVYEVTVTPQRPFAEGANFAMISVSTGLEGEAQIPIACRLFSPPILEVSPESIILGAPPARDMPRIVELRYNGEGEMNILSVTTTDEAVSASVKAPEPGKRYQVTITLPAGLEIAGERPIQVKIATSYDQRPEIIVPITMRTAVPREGVRTTAEALVGRAAPQMTVRTTTDGVVALGGGEKVMAVNFWASWGQDSARQLPMINRIAQTYRRRGVEFLLVSVDDMRTHEEIMEKAKQLNVNLPIGLDSDRNVSRTYGVDRWPALVLIGKHGAIEAVHRGIGRTTEDIAALQAKIESQLDTLLEGQTRQAFSSASAPTGSTVADDVADLSPPPIEAPLLVVESLRQDTGLHKPGQPVQYSLYVHNAGQKRLEVSEVSGPQGVKVDIDEIRILETGVRGRLKVTFDAPAEPGQFARAITIKSNDMRRPSVVVALTGSTRSYIEVDPPEGVDFSRLPRLHSMPRLVTLTYNGEGTVKYLKVESSSPRFKAEVDPIPNTPYAKVTVRSEPPFQPGLNDGVIRITTDCPQQPLVELPARLFLPPRIEVTPAEVVVPQALRLQQSTVQIVNNGQQPLNVLGITKSNEQIATQFYPLPDGLSYEMRMTIPAGYKSPEGGDRVTVRTDDSEHPEIVIPIRSAVGPVSQR